MKNTTEKEAAFILEGIFKGLLQWIYGLILEIVEYIANGLLDVFSMDLAYFEAVIPVTGDILNIVTAAGWALLLGNLVFQAAKTMMSGLGFEGEDPATLFARTFVFGFFLLASRQICDIGLGISHTLIVLLQVPNSVSVSIPGETMFSIGASWLLAIIVGFVLMWQLIKLFFEIGERYFLVGLLTVLSPLAFAMGGSKNTADIFKGWARMFASMCLLMVLNVVLLKMLLSAMGNMPSGAGVVPWLILVVAVARAARKLDDVIWRIGLNPAATGTGLGRSFPGMLVYIAARSAASTIGKAAGGAASRPKTPPNGGRNPPGASAAGTKGPPGGNGPSSRGGPRNPSNTQAASGNPSQQAGPGAAGTPPPGATTQASAASPGAAGTAPSSATSSATGGNPSTATTNSTANQASFVGNQPHAGGRNTMSAEQNGATQQQTTQTRHNSSRRSSVAQQNSERGSAFRSETTKTADNTGARPGQNASPLHPPIPRSGKTEENLSTGAAGTAPQESNRVPRPARYSAVPPSHSATSPGVAGKATPPDGIAAAQRRSGGVIGNAPNQPGSRAAMGPQPREQSSGAIVSGEEAQRNGANARAREGAAESSLRRRGAAGTETRRDPQASVNPANRVHAETPRGGRNTAPALLGAQSVSGKPPARRENSSSVTGNTRITRQPPPGMAGKQSGMPSGIPKETTGGTKKKGDTFHA